MRRTQEQRSAETKAAINEATIRCLIARGYAGTTMTSVPEAAGVSRGAVTHHFASKQEMLLAAIDHLARRLEVDMRAASERSADDTDRLSAVMQMLWQRFRGDLFYAANELWTAARTDPILHQALSASERQLGRRHRQLIADLLGEEIASLPNFALALDTTLNLMRGMAVTGILRDDESKEQALLEGWIRSFTQIAADQPAQPGK